jgi:ubiquinone/menaquinone biosynthesis C-methylase UbiE
MSTVSRERVETSRWADGWDIWRCPNCRGALAPRASGPGMDCLDCGAGYAIEDGILIIKDRTADNNGIAQDFYDSPLWPKFRFWEKFTWFCNGGERRARNAVLRHLPDRPRLDLLDVAIGDGVYLDWLPKGWRIAGVDISRSQLDACRRRAEAAGIDFRLAQCEAEGLPLADRQFDAVLSIGAFNYFNDPEVALREMVRVARPGAPIVISDEMPDLTDRMLGHKLGMPALDRWIVSRLMHLGDSFTDMVERYRDLDVLAIARRVMPDAQLIPVWRGVGYVLVGRAPA